MNFKKISAILIGSILGGYLMHYLLCFLWTAYPIHFNKQSPLFSDHVVFSIFLHRVFFNAGLHHALSKNSTIFILHINHTLRSSSFHYPLWPHCTPRSIYLESPGLFYRTAWTGNEITKSAELSLLRSNGLFIQKNKAFPNGQLRCYAFSRIRTCPVSNCAGILWYIWYDFVCSRYFCRLLHYKTAKAGTADWF